MRMILGASNNEAMMILDALIGKIAEKVVELIHDRVVTVLGVRDDLQRLQRRLEFFECVVADAERRRTREKPIDVLVRQLKHAMYDADDMIDLCRIKGAQLLRDGPSSSSSMVSYCLPLFSCLSTLPLRKEIGSEIESLNNRLDMIMKDMRALNLSKDVHIANNLVSRVDRHTSELVDPNVVGKDVENATNMMVELLVSSEPDQRKCVLFALTGMGGIGKTTLAQQIFNDERVEAKFSLKAWVCVSNIFDVIDLLKQIIRKVGASQGKATSKGELELILKNAVSGSDLLLVLDDVWPGGERVWKDSFRIPLESGASSCRVLITTRDELVAKRMRAQHIHKVNQLSVSSGWELLCKLVFVDGQEREIASLENVGKQIVEKCGGLPLAIKAISGILLTKKANKREWEDLLASNTWSMLELPEELRGARGTLYLSYENLPSHLKMCFLYLSLFPEDFEYDPKDMVRMWVAEGFVKPQGKSLLEDVGEGYFEELIRRNILQSFSEDSRVFYYKIHRSYYKMHDLMRSLAQYLSQEEGCFYIASATEFQARRLGCTGELTTIPTQMLHQKTLRTLLFFRPSTGFGNDALVRLKYLRVLRLAGSRIESFPESLGNLIHLRLVDLSHTRISMVPQGISRLTNLQTLNLSFCESLHSLPNGITQLCSLRHLVVIGTPLNYLPKGIGRLKQLTELDGFIVGEDIVQGNTQDHRSNLEELGSLFQLRNLRIKNLERAKVTASSAIFTNNIHLRTLWLSCTERYGGKSANNLRYSEQEVDELQKLFEQLLPPPTLEKLLVDNYFGRSFPVWMMETSLADHLPYLTELFLFDCTKCSHLPPLGQLPQLKCLKIRGASSIISIGPDFLGTTSGEGNNVPQGVVVFAKLEVLYIAGMPNWEEWSLGEEFDQRLPSSSGLQLLPCLRQLTLRDIPKLRELPNGLRHCSIQNFKITGAGSLKRVGHLPRLTRRLELLGCRSLERISHLPTLRELYIGGSPALACVERLDSLSKLKLKDDSMEHLPEWLSRPIKQRRAASPYDNLQLEMRCNKEVLERCGKGCPDWPIIQHFSRVNARQCWGGRASFLYTNEPSGRYKFDANF